MDASKIIPQFYFDMIARVVPGVVTLTGISIASETNIIHSQIKNIGIEGLSDSTWFFIFLYFLASYVIGHLLSPFGDLWQRKVLENIPFLKSKFHLLANAVKRDESPYSDDIIEFIESNTDYHRRPKEEHTPTLFIWSDFLRQVNPDVGARLVKLRAEYNMGASVSAGALVMLMYHGIKVAVSDVSISLPFIAISFLIFVSASLATVNSYYIFQRSTLANYYVIKKLKPERNTTSQSEEISINTDNSGISDD